MRAVGLTEFGGPEVLRVLEVDDTHAGPGEVRIRSRAFSVNPADTLLRAGQHRRRPGHEGPHVPGMDVAGTVDEIGDGTVTELEIGDAVMAMVVPRNAHGGYCEQVVLPADAVAAIPAGATFAEASTLPMNGLTARLTLDTFALAPGATLAVTGAAGCYGGYMIQLGIADGLSVIADASDRDIELVRDLGADAVVARGDRVAAEIRHRHPDGVDALADGALQGEVLLDAVRDRGQFASVRGWPGVPTRDIRFHQIMVTDLYQRRDLLADLSRQAAAGAVTLRVAEVFDAGHAADAHRMLESGGTRGRAVVVWD